MIKVSAEKLVPGMKLAKPVLAANGMILVGEGAELNAAWIERIQQLNVQIVYVEGTSEVLIPKAVMLKQLELRFKHVVDNPSMARLKKIVEDHIEGMYE